MLIQIKSKQKPQFITIFPSLYLKTCIKKTYIVPTNHLVLHFECYPQLKTFCIRKLDNKKNQASEEQTLSTRMVRQAP